MKTYAFHVTGTFTIEYSFAESEIDPGAADGIVPTGAALRSLEEELLAVLSYGHAIDAVDLDVDSDNFLGVTEHGDA